MSRVLRYLILFFMVFGILGVAYPSEGLSYTHSHLSKKKKVFLAKMLPLAVGVNESVLIERERVLLLFDWWRLKHRLNKEDSSWLKSIAVKYKFNHLTFDAEKDWNKLLQRVDIIPVSLILSQAANESAWGKSRFARNGNSYFGQWCFQKGCGIVPLRRGAGKHHEIRVFPSVYDSVVSYVRNLNTNPVFIQFRMIRADFRARKMQLRGKILAEGLTPYSQRGVKYVKSLRDIMKRDHFEVYDS